MPHRRRTLGLLLASGGLMVAGSAAAQIPTVADKYHITDQERAACTGDAFALCSGSYPDEDQLLTCMKINRTSLSASCRVVFDAGLRRRHL